MYSKLMFWTSLDTELKQSMNMDLFKYKFFIAYFQIKTHSPVISLWNSTTALVFAISLVIVIVSIKVIITHGHIYIAGFNVDVFVYVAFVASLKRVFKVMGFEGLRTALRGWDSHIY